LLIFRKFEGITFFPSHGRTLFKPLQGTANPFMEKLHLQFGKVP
jgi:hypothetical protein